MVFTSPSKHSSDAYQSTHPQASIPILCKHRSRFSTRHRAGHTLVTSSRGICRPSVAHISARPLPDAPEGTSFGTAIPSPYTFHPRGFSPPRRFTPRKNLRACCIPLATMGFLSFWPSRTPEPLLPESLVLQDTSSISVPPFEVSPSRQPLSVAGKALPSCRCPRLDCAHKHRVATASVLHRSTALRLSPTCLPMHLPSRELFTQPLLHSPRSHVPSLAFRLSSQFSCENCRFSCKKLQSESEDSLTETRSLALIFPKKHPLCSEEQSPSESLFLTAAKDYALGHTTDSNPSEPACTPR